MRNSSTLCDVQFDAENPSETVHMGPVQIRHSSHDWYFATQSSHMHLVGRAGWQAEMASIEFGYHDVMGTSTLLYLGKS